MSPRDDYTRDSVQPYTERGAAESLFTGEAAEEPAPVINEWYQGNAPFVEGRELQEMYRSEAKEEDYPTELEDEEAYEPTYEASELELYREPLAGEDGYPVTQSAGTERLLQEHFESLVGEAKALLDNMASDLRRYGRVDMSDAEMEAFLNQYRPVGIQLPQGFEYFLNDVRDTAKRLFKGAGNLTKSFRQ